MPKTQFQDTLFQMTTIQKMNNDVLTKFIKDLNDDLDKEELQRNTKFFVYCQLLLETAKKEQENRNLTIR